jgi:putative acetyltransferase
VSPEYRAKGIGKHMLSFLINVSAGETLSLFVAASNIDAIGLYKKSGFVAGDKFETNYNGQSVYAIKMVRPI